MSTPELKQTNKEVQKAQEKRKQQKTASNTRVSFQVVFIYIYIRLVSSSGSLGARMMDVLRNTKVICRVMLFVC